MPRESPAERPGDRRERGVAAYPPASRAGGFNERPLRVLVATLAHKLLDKVVNGDDAEHSAENRIAALLPQHRKHRTRLAQFFLLVEC